MGQIYKTPGASSGPKMTDAEIFKQVTDYSSGYKPKPTGQGKQQARIDTAMHEVFHNKPRTVDTSKSPEGQRKQMVAIALSKARRGK